MINMGCFQVVIKTVTALTKRFGVLIVIIAASVITSGANRFDKPPVNGFEAECIKVNPHNTNVLYAGIVNNGLYKSVDGGAKWSYCGYIGLIQMKCSLAMR